MIALVGRKSEAPSANALAHNVDAKIMVEGTLLFHPTF
jgi:hypothetical protein